jgi:hypothetical protein
MKGMKVQFCLLSIDVYGRFSENVDKERWGKFVDKNKRRGQKDFFLCDDKNEQKTQKLTHSFIHSFLQKKNSLLGGSKEGKMKDYFF